MGAGGAGQVAAATSSDTTDLINILQKDVNPALAKIGDTYINQKQDAAKEKINQLFLTKDSATIQKEILNGEHPELSSQYVQKTVSLHTGKYEAAAAIAEIEKNKQDKYNFKTDNLPAFYKNYLPEFGSKDGSYALGFASVFNEYKADEAVKDASKRSQWAQDQKIQQGVIILDTAKAGEVIARAEGMQYNLPPDSSGNKKRQFFTNDELNDVYMAWAENKGTTAKTPEQIDEALLVLQSARKTDANGKVIVGSLESTKRKDVASLIGKLNVRRVTLENQSRADKEFQIKEKKTNLWLKSLTKKEDGTMPTLSDIQTYSEEYKQIDAADIRGYQNFINWHNTDPKDRVVADPAVNTKFKLNISRNVYETHAEMMNDFVSLGIQGDAAAYTTMWKSALDAGIKGKPIFDTDPNYLASKSSVKQTIQALYPKDGLGNTKYFPVWDKAQDYMDEQILDTEAAWKKEGKTPSPSERRTFALQLKKDVGIVFPPTATDGGNIDTLNKMETPDVTELRAKEKAALAREELAQEAATRRDEVLNTVVSSVDSGDGSIIETTVGDVVDNISNAIQVAGKQELFKGIVSGVIKGKDGKTAEQVSFEKLQVPDITRYVKKVLGAQFTEDVLAALPDQDYSKIVTNIAQSFNLIKKVPKGAKNAQEITQQNNEYIKLIGNIIQNATSEK